MRFFTCLIDRDGCGIPDVARRAYESLPRARSLAFGWHSAGRVEVLTGWDDAAGDPLIAQEGSRIVVGTVRLDNRGTIERWAGRGSKTLTDLQLVLRVVAQNGPRYLSDFVGDFAFVFWDSCTRTGLAACDAFAVKKLYYAECDGILAFSSRAEALATGDEYEQAYLLELLITSVGSRQLTAYAGVRPLPGASMAILDSRSVTVRPYWSTTDFAVEPAWAKAEGEAIEACRQLLVEAVCHRVTDDGATWAELSGGLDSSSVVSLVQWLAGRGELLCGLGGTVTYADRRNTGADERAYSDVVATRWNVRNEAIVDAPAWHDDQHAPPHTDQPSFGLRSYPRAHRACAAVRDGGGRVLLTGFGGDELFGGSMFFFADWLVEGRVWPAVREMVRRAAIGRVSFWELAYRNAVLPLLPRAAHFGSVQAQFPVAPWLQRDMMRRFDLTSLQPMCNEYQGPIGQKYRHAIGVKVAGLAGLVNRDELADVLDVRHPFLYRPLVEFALRLPPELRVRPHAHRWVLREAMRDILPETVRRRVGKPDTGDFLAWCLVADRHRLAPLLRDPILAELGLVDAGKLRTAFDTALEHISRKECMHAEIIATLEVEAWLQVRSGRWPRGGHLGTRESLNKT